MKNSLHIHIERYLFFPNLFHRIISIVVFPLTLVYCFVVLYKRVKANTKYNFSLPVISVGNLTIGGSGKTPLIEAIAKRYDNTAVVLRGYKRESKGLLVVSKFGKIETTVENSGDEAMLLSHSLNKSTIIVSEDRKKGIIKAKELGCKVVLLDDAFAKFDIEKFDILIRPKTEPTNLFCLPSGGYKEPKSHYSLSNMVLQDGVDFHRLVSFEQDGKTIDSLPSNIICLTAISSSHRLKEFLPTRCKIVSYIDHYSWSQDDIDDILKRYPKFYIITTTKDIVKLKKFDLSNLILMRLDIQIKQKHMDKIDKYIKDNI